MEKNIVIVILSIVVIYLAVLSFLLRIEVDTLKEEMMIRENKSNKIQKDLMDDRRDLIKRIDNLESKR